MEDLKQIQEFFSKDLEEAMSKSAIMRQIKDAEEILDSGEANGEPLTSETEMLVQNELKRLRSLLKSVNEMDINDPILVKMRAAKMKANQPKKSINPNYKAVKNASKISFLKKERAQLVRDMEQEAEPEGGPIADEYGSKLNRIDAAIAKLEGRKEMTYDQAIAEDISIEEMESFAEGRGEGAETIAENAKEKGGNSMLTYHHFKVKAPYYKKASDGNFDKDEFTEDYKGFLEELYEKTKDGMNIEPVAFQEIMGKIEVLGELLVENKEPLNEQEDKDDNRVPGAALILPRGKEVILQAEEKDYKRGLLVELTNKGGYKIKYWYGDDVKVYPAEVEVDGKSIKKDAKVVDILFHPELKENIKKSDLVNELTETIQLGLQLNEKELCAKGKAYIKKRKAAGEKSSAYLSGRAVRVCKGTMKG